MIVVQFVLDELESSLSPYDVEDIVDAYADELHVLIDAIHRAVTNETFVVSEAPPIPEQVQRCLRTLNISLGAFLKARDKRALVRASFLDLARRFHSDKNVRASAHQRARNEEIMRDINRARERIILYLG